MINHVSTMPNPVFFFNDTATTEIYTLSLHDALPISALRDLGLVRGVGRVPARVLDDVALDHLRGEGMVRSEEHTSELQSQSNLVCRLLLEKKKIIPNPFGNYIVTGNSNYNH